MIEIKDLTVEKAIELLLSDVTDEKLKNTIRSSFDESETGNVYRDILESTIDKLKEK